MRNKFAILFIILLLVLPVVLAEVKIQLGSPYIDIEDLSQIKFLVHSDYYEICSSDKTIIPVLIKNKNEFSDIFQFRVDKEYASLPVKKAVLKSGKSAVLPLTIRPIGLEENTTLILDVITKKERLKRSVIIKTNIKKCYLFELKLDKDKDEICGCDKEEYGLILNNDGVYTDTFTLIIDAPEWVNSTLTNETIKLYDGQKKEIKLEANPSCEEKGIFNINAKAVSGKTKVVKEAKLGFAVIPKKECYNTIITADDVRIDYFGKNIPITIRNKGIKDATYSLIAEGIDWYKLSQTDFSLKQNREKTINLALYPDEDVVEGDYNIDIKAKADAQEFTKSITVKLRKKGVVFEKIKFYVNYFRYYIGLIVVLLFIILLLIILVKERKKKKGEKPVKKEEEKKIAKKVKKTEKIRWLLPLILYLIFLGLLLLIAYSTFKHRSYYEKALNLVSGIFTTYAIPYGSYLRYLLVGVCVILIIMLMIDFFRKKPKKAGIKKEKVKEKITEVRKAPSKKIVKRKRKLNLFEYIYLVLVVLLFLAIIGYSIYRFSGKPIPVDKFVLVKDIIKNYSNYFYNLINYIKDFLVIYYPYILMGIGVLVILILILHFHSKKVL